MCHSGAHASSSCYQFHTPVLVCLLCFLLLGGCASRSPQEIELNRAIFEATFESDFSKLVDYQQRNPNLTVLENRFLYYACYSNYIGGQFKYSHFASHDTFNASDPLNSALLLASDSENDGRLTVSELYDSRMDADLVTLSACETALGKIANGDDVVGFTRGFLFAGAGSIVSSLWQVDDEATASLMRQFYRNLDAQNKQSALRSAQLGMLSGRYHHPFYWSAFQLTGSGI